MKRIEKCLVFADITNPNVLRYLPVVEKELKEKKIELIKNPRLSDAIIVLGGDGTMLEAGHKYYDFKKPFLGLNFGGKGFLMNDITNDKNDYVIRDIVEKIANGKFNTFTFPLLSLKARVDNGDRVVEKIAINDVYFNRMTRQSCRLNIKINGEMVAERITGDGVIICTALGSTGYNLSAGGPIIYPLTPAICVTGICIHDPLQFKPSIRSIDDIIEVEILEPEKRRVMVTADIAEYQNVISAIIKKSEKKIKMIFLEGQDDFTKRLVKKIYKTLSPDKKSAEREIRSDFYYMVGLKPAKTRCCVNTRRFSGQPR